MGPVSKKVTGEVEGWSSSALHPPYLVVFVEAIAVTVGDGQVNSTLFCVVMGVTVGGESNTPGSERVKVRGGEV